MIVWLDDQPFPPADAVKDAARAVGAAFIVSTPWPREFADLAAGANELPEPVFDGPEEPEN